MEPAFTPAMKWTIGLLTAVFVGLGSWLGVIVYRNTHQPLVSVVSTPLAVPSSLPAPVETTLMEPASSSTPSTSEPKSAKTDVPVKTLVSTAAVSKGRQNSASTVTTVTEPTLEASVASAAANNQITITVAANQLVQLGFGNVSGEFVMAKSLTLVSFTGTKILIVRSRGGQELRYEVTGSASTTKTSTSATAS